MIAIWHKEIESYYKNFIGWLMAAFLLLFAGIYCRAFNLSGYTARFERVLPSVTFLYLIAVPIISMRALAEERHAKTDQLLYSLPVTSASIVFGKYLGMLVVLAFPVVLLAVYPLVLSQFGNVRFLPAYGALFAFFLLGGCLLSIGLFVSSITDNQITAAVLTLIVMLILYFMNGLSSFVPADASASMIALLLMAAAFAGVFYLLTRNPLASTAIAVLIGGGIIFWYRSKPAVFGGLFTRVMKSLSIFDRFEPFVKGVFDLTSVVYYCSVIGVFLFMSVQSLEKRRWNE